MCVCDVCVCDVCVRACVYVCACACVGRFVCCNVLPWIVGSTLTHPRHGARHSASPGAPRGRGRGLTLKLLLEGTVLFVCLLAEGDGECEAEAEA